MPTTRKNIDFPDELVGQMDQLKDERRVTYNEIVIAAVQEYFAPKSEPVPVNVVDRLDGTAAQSGGRTEQAVEARVVDHPDDRRDPAPLLADQVPVDATELDFRGRQ